MRSTKYNGKYKVQFKRYSYALSTYLLCTLSFVLIYVVLCKLYFVLIYVVLCPLKSFKSLMHPKCEKKLTEIFDVTMSQCHNVTKLKLPPCNNCKMGADKTQG